MIQAKAYFKRFRGSVEGVWTLMVDGKTIIRRHPSRSGSFRGIDRPWLRGAGPIPESPPQGFRLWLPYVDNGSDFPTTPRGIGRFYPISSGQNRRLIIHPTNPDLVRWDVGAHPDNDPVGGASGSLGCPVWRWETRLLRANVQTIFRTLDELRAEGLESIDLHSFVGDRD